MKIADESIGSGGEAKDLFAVAGRAAECSLDTRETGIVILEKLI
jgi:hypothetical protein